MRHVVLASFLTICAVQAQSPELTDWEKAAGGKMAFDVASVKPTKFDPGKLPLLPNLPLDLGDAKPPGGRFSAGFGLSAYVSFAYKILTSEIRGLPKWADTSFDIEARAAGNPTKDQMRLMMQSLLADRFKLRVHFETKEGPVFALTLVKPGKLGPKLHPHSEGPPCPESFEMIKPFAPISSPKAGVAFPPQCGWAQTVGTSDGTWIGSRNTTMGSLAHDIYAYGPLFGEVGKPVVDQTGLEGRFDYVLEFPAGMISLFPKPPNPDDPLSEPKGTPLLNALRQQLGLKLTPDKGPVRALVIDHVEKPSEN
jgi:bla regulator protein BlaR1